MKKKIFLQYAVLFVAIVSCTDQAVKPEKDKAMEYLVANGFRIGDALPSSSNLKPQRVTTVEEAKKIVAAIKAFDEQTADVSLSRVGLKGKMSDSNAIVACEDPGTYYISRALNGGISGVDITYSVDQYGYIGDILSFSTGLQLAWSWDQIGIRTFDPQASFCVQGIITYGIDLYGIPLGYRQAIALRVTLSGCSARVRSSYGGC